MGVTLEVDYGEELFLTPYIKLDTVSEGREKARVLDLIPAGEVGSDIVSYAGFLTVDPIANSNLFFWFFPAQEDPENAPVILWLQGGPGSSSLIGLFNEHGPYFVDAAGNLKVRNITWTKTHSVIYVDSPVGSGFSFTDSIDGFARNQAQISNQLYEGLRQFFIIFPEFQENHFYISGQSYAGKYVPCLAVKIHEENERICSCGSRDKEIRLCGIAVGSSFTDPAIQLNWGQHLYSYGLIDENGKAFIDAELERMKECIRAEKWMEAFKILQKTMFGFPPGIPTHYEDMTGLQNSFNLTEASIGPHFFYYRKFLEQADVRRKLHLGKRFLTNFGQDKEHVFMSLAEDIPQSCSGDLDDVLEAGYRVLLYSAQFDVVVPHAAVEALIQALDWSKRNGYKKAARKIWKVNGETAGYAKEVSNLTYTFVRNAGHMTPADAPEACFDMIDRFTRGLSFAS